MLVHYNVVHMCEREVRKKRIGYLLCCIWEGKRKEGTTDEEKREIGCVWEKFAVELPDSIYCTVNYLYNSLNMDPPKI